MLISSPHRRPHLQFLFEQRREVHRNRYCGQFSAARKRVWQSIAPISPTRALNTDLAPIGDDFEPIEAPREDIEMGNDENEEPIGSTGSQSKNESEESHESRESKDMLCTEIVVLLVSKVEELVDNIELNCWRKRKEKERLHMLL